MKTSHLSAIVLATLFSSNAAALSASFADASWDGIKVPDGQQCQKFGGVDPATPRLKVSDIPAGTTALVLEYSDRSYPKMDNGGHGKMSFAISAPSSEVELPSTPGHSFDLTKGFSLIQAHLSPGWDKAGAYMPPCSGGKGNAYYVTIKAMEGEQVKAETVLELGKF